MKTRWSLLPSVMVAVLLLVGGTVTSAPRAQETGTAVPAKDFTAAPAFQVIRVVDGDTAVLLVDGKQTTFRLIGVDTPETVHPQKPVEAYGKEASRFLANLLKGESVFLKYEPGASKLDKYGRTLAYLYRAPDGLFVNLEIIKQGYGHAYTRFPFQYMDLFRSEEQKAREAEKGLWDPALELPSVADAGLDSTMESGDGPSTGEPQVYRTTSGMKYHREACRYLSKSKIVLTLTEAQERGLAPCSVCDPPR